MYSIILDDVEYRSKTPMYVAGTATYSVMTPVGQIVTSHSPIHIREI